MTMKTFFQISIVSIAILAFTATSANSATIYGGQTDTTSTTLSVALPLAAPGTTPPQVCVASATGIVTPSLSGNTTGSYLMVDAEAMQVTTAGSSTTCFNVRRGALGTSAQYSHAKSATVWVGNAAVSSGDTSRPFTGAFISIIPSGTCVASAQYSLPVIITGDTTAGQIYAGQTYYCVGGWWTRGDPQFYPPTPYTVFSTLVMPNAIATTTFTDVSGKLWYSQLNVPYNTKSTGACALNSTVGTDSVIYALWDGAGNLLATTALAGTATAVNSKYQCIAWVNAINLQGPSTYYIGLMGNGTADSWQAYATGGAPSTYAVGVQTGGSFGTVLKLASPSVSFTTAQGPLMTTY
jgi:hypothetical protein